MKKFITKSSMVAIMMVAGMSISMSSYAAENPTSVKIESQGNLKFLISPEFIAKGLTVNIYDEDKNLLIQEPLKSKKVFYMGNLLDGSYSIEVLDVQKNVVNKKSFSIKTETKRDVIAKN